MDELRELIALIQENGFAEFELEREGFRIHVRRDLAESDVAADSAAAPVARCRFSSARGRLRPRCKGCCDPRSSGSAGRNSCLGRSGSPNDSVSDRRNLLPVALAEQLIPS